MHHPASRLMQGLPRSWRTIWRPLSTVLRMFAIALMVIGLARPQIVQGRETITGEGVDIALAWTFPAAWPRSTLSRTIAWKRPSR